MSASGVYMYEFEDKLWDEFCRPDDHIVPRPGFDDNLIRGDTCKRPSEKGEYLTPSKRQKKMLDEDSFSAKPSGFSESIKEALNSASDSFDLFEEDGKKSADFLNYGWPEIENFEDVDEMFRSCDSTYGLGSSAEDNLSWISSVDVMKNSDYNESSKSFSGSLGEQVQFSEDKFENHADAVRLVELGSSNVEESSAVGSGDISLEVASLDQLQLVVKWMDLSTKIQIRDGLYRLARSSEQRHKHTNLSGDSDEENASKSFMDDEAHKCSHLMAMETNTNPIDRCIAQLLFHRS